MTPVTLRALRALGLLAALWVVAPGLLHPFRGGLLDGVNLVFHEAGHVLFSLFGETLTLLGGSLMQLLVPGGIATLFLVRRDPYAAGIMGLWLAHSLASVAAYVRDAPYRHLDLITGDPDTHDWWQILGGWDALNLAAPIGGTLAFLAFAAVVLSVLLIILLVFGDRSGREASPE